MSSTEHNHHPVRGWFDSPEDAEAQKRMDEMASAGHEDEETLVMPAVMPLSDQDGPYGWTEDEQPRPLGSQVSPAPFDPIARLRLIRDEAETRIRNEENLPPDTEV